MLSCPCSWKQHCSAGLQTSRQCFAGVPERQTCWQVEFRNVKMRYRENLPLVLHGLSVTVPAGSRCGVVCPTIWKNNLKITPTILHLLLKLTSLDAGLASQL